MKKIISKFQFLTLTAICLFCLPCIAQKVTNVWVSPTYKAEAYKKIVVLVKVTDDSKRRILEDAMVNELNEKKYNAINSYSNFSVSDLETEEALIKRADSLGVDALVYFSDPNIETQYQQKPVVTANVGVPVKVGFMHVYLGTGIPLGKGGSRKKETITLKSSFYNKSSRDPQWSIQLTDDFKGDINSIATKFARKTITNLYKSKVLL